jgi:hypothetical protein
LFTTPVSTTADSTRKTRGLRPKARTRSQPTRSLPRRRVHRETCGRRVAAEHDARVEERLAERAAGCSCSRGKVGADVLEPGAGGRARTERVTRLPAVERAKAHLERDRGSEGLGRESRHANRAERERLGRRRERANRQVTARERGTGTRARALAPARLATACPNRAVRATTTGRSIGRSLRSVDCADLVRQNANPGRFRNSRA